MFLKIMSNENAPDGDTRKTFRILDDVTAVDFRRDPDGKAEAAVLFRQGPGERFSPGGNCYLLNERLASKRQSSGVVYRPRRVLSQP